MLIAYLLRGLNYSYEVAMWTEWLCSFLKNYVMSFCCKTREEVTWTSMDLPVNRKTICIVPIRRSLATASWDYQDRSHYSRNLLKVWSFADFQQVAQEIECAQQNDPEIRRRMKILNILKWFSPAIVFYFCFFLAIILFVGQDSSTGSIMLVLSGVAFLEFYVIAWMIDAIVARKYVVLYKEIARINSIHANMRVHVGGTSLPFHPVIWLEVHLEDVPEDIRLIQDPNQEQLPPTPEHMTNMHFLGKAPTPNPNGSYRPVESI